MLTLLLCVLVVSSCRRLPNVQGTGEEFLQGVWNQDTIPNADKLLNYTTHKFRFTCDSFYVDLVTHSKVNYYADSCFNNGVWNEYAKGVYRVKNDSLFLGGTYTHENYKQKITGCYHIGRFEKTFLIKSRQDSILSLIDAIDEKGFSLRLATKTTCVPKEL